MKLCNNTIDALRLHDQRKLADWVVAHVRKHWPEAHAHLGEPGLGDTVRAAIEQARTYGIKKEVNIVRYVNLVMVLGPRLADHPAVPWVGQVLRDADLDERRKLKTINDRLDEATLDRVPDPWSR